MFPNGQSCNHGKQFKRHDFRLFRDQSLSITVRWSKTIHFREREYCVRFPVLRTHPLCPVTAISKAFQMTSSLPSASLAFPMSGKQFDKRLKETIDGSRGHFSPHNFRRGGATHALATGSPSEIIRIFGDWKPQVYLACLDQMPENVVNDYRVQFALSLPTQ